MINSWGCVHKRVCRRLFLIIQRTLDEDFTWRSRRRCSSVFGVTAQRAQDGKQEDESVRKSETGTSSTIQHDFCTIQVQHEPALRTYLISRDVAVTNDDDEMSSPCFSWP
jgi:hypothetical protein